MSQLTPPPRHTHTHLVPGNLVSGNMLYSILKFEAIVFIQEHMSKKKGTYVHCSSAGRIGIFFLGRETFEVTLRIFADKHLLLNGYFILSPDFLL